jgi:hypothetical protein
LPVVAQQAIDRTDPLAGQSLYLALHILRGAVDAIQRLPDDRPDYWPDHRHRQGRLGHRGRRQADLRGGRRGQHHRRRHKRNGKHSHRYPAYPTKRIKHG